MTVPLSDEEREFVFQLVRRAGDFALSHWPAGEEQRSFTVEQKEDGSPVTSVDIAVNEMLYNEFSRHFPDYGFYSEELEPSSNIHDVKRCWVLDPIDGTKNFEQGHKEFGVLLGLVENGRAIFGVAYFPAFEMFFWAGTGQGAFCNGEPMMASEQKDLLPRSVYVRNGGIAAEEYIFPQELGTAHGFFFLCTGKVDALSVRITQHKEWDYCPFVVIVEESGAVVTDERGEPVRFHFMPPTLKYIVAANKKLHPKVLDLLPRLP
ncbi:MAG: inositol monophosphatase [Bdellovibrionales bacterium]|nr:inositol monophosphatase [Bdellovibrionales bacterium]